MLTGVLVPENEIMMTSLNIFAFLAFQFRKQDKARKSANLFHLINIFYESHSIFQSKLHYGTWDKAANNHHSQNFHFLSYLGNSLSNRLWRNQKSFYDL